MNLRLAWVAVVAVAAFFACGGSPPAQGVAVKQQPLSGTVGGQPWTARAALLEGPFSDGLRFLNIYDGPVPCDDFGPKGAHVLTSVTWAVGVTDGQQVTFVLPRDGGSPLNIATFGQRLEILDAPDAGQGTLRLRATNGGSENAVEGETPVTVCD